MTQLLRTPSRSWLSRALWVLALTGITACSDLFGPTERVVVMDIAPQRVPCVGVGPMQCLSVREHPDTAWTLLYDGIEGFSFEPGYRSEEHTSELQSQSNLVCRLLLEKKKCTWRRTRSRSRRCSAPTATRRSAARPACSPSVPAVSTSPCPSAACRIRSRCRRCGLVGR